MSEETSAQAETPESLSSVKLVQNAKGTTQIEVKIYNEDPDKAKETAVRIYKELRENNDIQ